MSDRGRILFVDDRESHIESWQAYLSDFNCETDFVTDSAVVLARVVEFRPHIVILNPLISDGLDICRRIKADPSTRKTMVLMISSQNELGDLECAVDAGTDDFLSEPIIKSDLVKRVDNMLQFRQL